jgi:hypothetical protein
MMSRGAAGRLSSQAATFYEEDIEELVPRFDICFNNCENYVEKQFKVWKIWKTKRSICFHQLNHKLLAAPLYVCFYP